MSTISSRISRIVLKAAVVRGTDDTTWLQILDPWRTVESGNYGFLFLHEVVRIRYVFNQADNELPFSMQLDTLLHQDTVPVTTPILKGNSAASYAH